MKEYGGYIEFETFHGKMLHENAVALNCGRNALAYLCKAKKIKKVYLPYFICSSVPDLCKKIGVECEKYSINKHYEPIFNHKLENDEWLYIVNFYGQLSNDYLNFWKKKYGRIIVDNAQSYYQMPIDGVDTLYTARKYFGVADGAFLYTDKKLNEEIPVDESFERMHFLLGRYERNANEFYSEYASNNKLFAIEPIKQMSKLTKNILCSIDYERIAEQRQSNFELLNKSLNSINQLQVKNVYGAFMYPLLVKDGAAIRKILQKEKIYIPTLWPYVLENCVSDSFEYHLANDTLPIPVDQRYDSQDMEYLVEVIRHVSTQRT